MIFFKKTLDFKYLKYKLNKLATILVFTLCGNSSVKIGFSLMNFSMSIILNILKFILVKSVYNFLKIESENPIFFFRQITCSFSKIKR